MSEAVLQSEVQKLQLDSTHQRLGAAMIDRDGWSVPGSYGEMLSEYAAVRDGGAGLIDLSTRGRLLVTGSESVQFLNGLITNDMKTLEPDHWMPAAFPNVQGRLLAMVRVCNQNSRQGAPAFLIDTEAATHQQVFKTVQRFTLAGDFHVEDLTSSTTLLSLQGPGAPALIETLFPEAAGVPRLQRVQADWKTTPVTVMRASHTAADGFDLLVNSEVSPDLWAALTSAGARPVGYVALEILRIEAGIPRYGVDMDETNVVSETGLDDAISFTKGCYLGQEIIARIKYRGHVAKKLTGLVFDGSVSAAAGLKITSVDDKEIGRLTSATDSPRLGRTIALGYVKYDYLASGTKVNVGEATAKVVELPFVVSRDQGGLPPPN
jgi:folate-binding protein YgfZ